MTFDEWYKEFQGALKDESRMGMLPKGMDKESYREDYDDGVSPSERADQEMDDLARALPEPYTSKKLVKIATEFRDGMLQGLPSVAMCFVICSALIGYLRYEGIECELIEGEVGNSNHFWIELTEGNILDPTADQFKKPDGSDMPKVYCGELPEWYI